MYNLTNLTIQGLQGLQGLQIKMIITITIVSDQYRNTKDKKNKIKLKNDTNGPIR